MTATATVEVAPGKFNVCLFLGPTREHDGRHELVTVLQAVELADDLRLVPAAGEDDEVHCAGVAGENLVTRAIAAFRESTGWDGPPVRVDIDKRIPVAAGMAGGSADAAAVLRMLATRAGGPGEPELLALAATLGADVPGLLRPGRVLATGAGEAIVALEPPAVAYGVLVLASEHALSTPDVFREADRLGLPRDTASLAERLVAVRARAADLPADLVVNELEPAARSLCPSIDDELRRVREAGADLAMVSGSGPTVVGLFADPQDADAAADALGGRAQATRPWGTRPA